MKKFLAAAATVFIAVALSVVAVAGPASAHTATLTGVPSCNAADGSGTIVWTVDNDYAETANVTASNNAVIPVGTTIDATNGHGDTTKTFTQHIPAPAAGVSVTTTLSFEWTGDGYTQPATNQHSYDTVKISTDCKVPTPKDASAALIDTPAACAAAETVALGTATNASWGTLTVKNGQYHAVATATGGHLFGSANGGTLSAGNTVDTFTGTLASALNPSKCQLASAAVVTTAATCQGPSTATEDTAGIKFATWTPITYKTVDGVTTYTAIATSVSGYEFPNGAGVSSNNTKLTLSGTIAGEVTGHPCEDYIIVAWTMPSWVNSTTPTWSQKYFTSQEESTPNLSALDSKLIEKCGVQYQVDIYYNSPTTASLIAGTVLSGPNNPPEDLISGGWGTAYKLVQGPACATPVQPKESDVCTVGGTVTVYAATGVEYFLNGNKVDTSKGNVTLTGLHGVNTVTAAAASGYLLEGYPANGWSYNINSDCTATYNSSGVCTASESTSQEDVTLNLVNTSGTSAKFVVTSTDSTVTPSGSYTVLANTTSQVDVGSTTQAGGTFYVSVNGATPIAVKVSSFDGCVLVTPGDPTATPLSCTATTTNLGTISTDGNPELIYTLYASDNTTLLGTFASTPPKATITDLAAGTYYVHVAHASGFKIGGGSVFPFKLVLDPVNCVGTNVTPVVSSANTCAATGIQPVHVTDATLHTDVTYVNGGVINLGQQPGILIFKINGVVQTATVVTEPNGGPYNVTVALDPAAAADGYSLTVPVDSSVPGGFGWSYNFSTVCPLPTLAVLPWSVTQGSTTCTTSGQRGTITVTNTPGELGTVSYTITNSKGVVVATTTGTNTYTLAPGSYNVRAVPSDTADFGLTPNTGTTAFVDTAITIGAAAVLCADTSLAFTGGTIAWAGFALAGGMLFLGIAFMLIRRRGNRTAE